MFSSMMFGGIHMGAISENIFLDVHLKIYNSTHGVLVTLYGDIALSQHWFSQWLVSWGNQAITWTNVD